MKLVKQSRLFFRQGKSDKVYEVDLCEVSDGKYVVNFRYGRRGSTLREGTKTTTPMALGDADRVFNQLVESKTSKGYGEDTGPAPPEAKAAKPLSAEDADARKNAILQRLRDGKRSASKWPLTRAIWRAGELNLTEAEPLLRGLVGIDEMTDYCVAWSLARLGQRESIPALEQIARSSSNREHVRHIATQALRLVADEASRQSLIAQAIDSLPDPLRSFLRSNSVAAFEQAFAEGLNKQYEPSLLSALYYIDTPNVRPALLKALAQVPLEPPFFRTLRRIYKTAELRRDGQVFGLLAYRFETSRAMFRRPSYVWRNYRNPAAEENAKKAFSAHTRHYLRRRVWRVLDRLGKGSDKSFVPMAVGVLLAFSDDDAMPVRTDSRYDWRSRSYQHMHWDPYGRYWALNQLLFRNSARYQAMNSQLTFRVADGLGTNSAPPAENEAAFVELWQAQPRGLLHLLTDSRCLIVHQFAAKTLRKCDAFCEQLPLEVLLVLLASTYEVTTELAFDLVVKRYDAANPNFELVLALANSGLGRARSQAHDWIAAQRNVFFADTEFAAQIYTSPHADTRKVGLESTHALPGDENALRALAGRLVAFLQGSNDEQSEIAEDVGQLLLGPTLHPSIATLGEDILCDLLASNVAAVQLFAGAAVLAHEKLSKSPTERVLTALLTASHAPVRSMGVKVISELPDEVLRTNVNMLATLTCHELNDIRNQIRPTVMRLSADEAFARQMSSELIQRLLTPGAPEGVPSHTSRVLREDFGNQLDHVPPETVWLLLQSRSGPAQEVGGHLLLTNVDHKTLSVVEIVKLTNHAILNVRRASWTMYNEQTDRMRSELSTAVRILDSSWEDSRQFGFQFFREKTTDQDLTPEVLISICDSVREDVQQFGRQMITQHFAKEHGPDYLLKLSEHPTTDLQLFASNFLVEFAAGHTDRIQQLAPYFVSILSRVNKSRVAKDRVLAFLREEAIKDRESAETIAEVLARISATCAIGDRASTIEAMLELGEAYPDIELPLSNKPVEVR